MPLRQTEYVRDLLSVDPGKTSSIAGFCKKYHPRVAARIESAHETAPTAFREVRHEVEKREQDINAAPEDSDDRRDLEP